MYVAVGGAVGAMLRFLAMSFIGSSQQGDFPFGTLFVNVAGAFLMGLLVALIAHFTPAKARDLHLLLAVGLLGGFTTFSAFTLDVFLLVERGQAMQASLYILGSLMLSVVALLGGMLAVKLVAG